MGDESVREKLIKRIMQNCDLYSNDFEYLNNLSLPEINLLYNYLLIPLIIKIRYKNRHSRVIRKINTQG